MKPSDDYFYRFPHENRQISGRCRVRIYQRSRGAHTVLLTELDNNSGESIASASERIVTNLVAARRLNPKTTHWIHHELADGDLPQAFDELRFSWDEDNTASDPQWHSLNVEQAEALTGDSLSAMSRRMGDLQPTEDASGPSQA